VRIYWANSFFSEADRRFNRHCTARLRTAGHEVFSPQESPYNKIREIDPATITKGDMVEVQRSQALVACIDQETIDCGVACEIGFAYGLEIPIIGLLTDLRMKRLGDGRMYKNPLVIGCIMERGTLVHSMNAVIEQLEELTRGFHGKRGSRSRS
jgi:nucleoside 2-deoxyribosyltransferase